VPANPNYFLKANSVYIAPEFENIGIGNESINCYNLNLDYGINENLLIGVDFSYLSLSHSDDGGVFGDVTANLKFLIYQYSGWFFGRIVSETLFRFPTGATREDSIRKIDSNTYSYFPFSTGNFLFSPSLQLSALIEDFAVNLSISYQSENPPGEGLLYFNVLHDRIDFQISLDYLFKIIVGENDYLIFRPVIYIDYKYNISPMPIIPDGCYFVIENNIKWNNIWKLSIYYSIPLDSNGIFNYIFGFQIGRYL